MKYINFVIIKETYIMACKYSLFEKFINKYYTFEKYLAIWFDEKILQLLEEHI